MADLPPNSVTLRLSKDDFDVRVKELRDGIDELVETARKYDHTAFLSVYPSILNLVRIYKEMDKATLPADGE
jgi:hypothetical protein